MVLPLWLYYGERKRRERIEDEKNIILYEHAEKEYYNIVNSGASKDEIRKAWFKFRLILHKFPTPITYKPDDPDMYWEDTHILQ